MTPGLLAIAGRLNLPQFVKFGFWDPQGGCSPLCTGCFICHLCLSLRFQLGAEVVLHQQSVSWGVGGCRCPTLLGVQYVSSSGPPQVHSRTRFSSGGHGSSQVEWWVRGQRFSELPVKRRPLIHTRLPAIANGAPIHNDREVCPKLF